MKKGLSCGCRLLERGRHRSVCTLDEVRPFFSSIEMFQQFSDVTDIDSFETSRYALGLIGCAMATTTAPVVTSCSQGALFFFAAFFAVTVFSIYDKDARVLDPTSPIAQHFAPYTTLDGGHGNG